MAISEISITSIFFIDQALPCADSHFLLLSFFLMAFQRRALEAFNEVELTQNHIKKDPGRLRHRSKKEHLWGDKVYLLLLEMNQKSIESSFFYFGNRHFFWKNFFFEKNRKEGQSLTSFKK